MVAPMPQVVLAVGGVHVGNTYGRVCIHGQMGRSALDVVYCSRISCHSRCGASASALLARNRRAVTVECCYQGCVTKSPVADCGRRFFAWRRLLSADVLRIFVDSIKTFPDMKKIVVFTGGGGECRQRLGHLPRCRRTVGELSHRGWRTTRPRARRGRCCVRISSSSAVPMFETAARIASGRHTDRRGYVAGRISRRVACALRAS